jgi:hypothetical protein
MWHEKNQFVWLLCRTTISAIRVHAQAERVQGCVGVLVCCSLSSLGFSL